MLYFFLLGFIVIATVFVLPESIFISQNIDRKKVLYVGIWSLSIAGLIFIFHNLWFIVLAILAIYIYNKHLD